jgi:hypothetical protein
MGDMSEYELRYLEDEVLVAAAKERARLLELHTGLRQAANHGHLSEAINLMKVEGIDINDKDGAGWSALAWACKMGRLELVKFLLSMDADIDSQDNVSETRWLHACSCSDPSMNECMLIVTVTLCCAYMSVWQICSHPLAEQGHAAHVGLSQEPGGGGRFPGGGQRVCGQHQRGAATALSISVLVLLMFVHTWCWCWCWCWCIAYYHTEIFVLFGCVTDRVMM